MYHERASLTALDTCVEVAVGVHVLYVLFVVALVTYHHARHHASESVLDLLSSATQEVLLFESLHVPLDVLLLHATGNLIEDVPQVQL